MPMVNQVSLQKRISAVLGAAVSGGAVSGAVVSDGAVSEGARSIRHTADKRHPILFGPKIFLSSSLVLWSSVQTPSLLVFLSNFISKCSLPFSESLVYLRAFNGFEPSRS